MWPRHEMYQTIPSPVLTVGSDNNQRWNQPAHRRHGFQNAHQLFRRTIMIRSRNVLMLDSADDDLMPQFPELADLLEYSAFSALCCLQGDRIVMEAAAPDCSVTNSRSIQSAIKLHIHMIIGQLLDQGLVSLGARVTFLNCRWVTF